MTRFERDYKACDDSYEAEVLDRRRAELERLWQAGKREKNGFRMQCIAQDYIRLKEEYDQLYREFME